MPAGFGLCGVVCGVVLAGTVTTRVEATHQRNARTVCAPSRKARGWRQVEAHGKSVTRRLTTRAAAHFRMDGTAVRSIR
ncbi:hypothetical protein WM40_22150 [Robbsia andropogonis]|uniref:Uncharacterized protein n=1 Tax=Robbsia andropogonis TaxID=28092 RepID=A0A0F5JUX1_9BURK|nr:hypothetical protein WM40_22150 [Robbsia andropogonis]